MGAPDSVRFFFSADVGPGPLFAYVSSCAQGTCTASDADPSPTNYDVTIRISAHAVQNLRLDSTSAAGFCSSPYGCIYYISLYPSANCGVGNPPCSPASFTVMAVTEGAGAPTVIPANAVSNGAVYVVEGSLSGTATDAYELYLPSTAGGAPLQFVLESGGPAEASLYICDPNPADAVVNGTRPCINAYAPSASDHTFAIGTANATSSHPEGGVAMLRLPSYSTARLLYLTVAINAVEAAARIGAGHAIPGKRGVSVEPLCPGDTICARYTLAIASGTAGVFVEGPPSPPAVIDDEADDVGTVKLTVGWLPATGTPANSPGAPPIQLIDAVYSVWVSGAGGFAAAEPAGTLTYKDFTYTGLISWTAYTGIHPVSVYLVDSANTSVVVRGVPENSWVEVAVGAWCDAACWQATGYPRVGATLASSAATVTKYYTGTGFPPAPKASVLPIALGVSLGGAALLAVCALALCFCIRRRKNGTVPTTASAVGSSRILDVLLRRAPSNSTVSTASSTRIANPLNVSIASWGALRGAGSATAASVRVAQLNAASPSESGPRRIVVQPTRIRSASGDRDLVVLATGEKGSDATPAAAATARPAAPVATLPMEASHGPGWDARASAIADAIAATPSTRHIPGDLNATATVVHPSATHRALFSPTNVDQDAGAR